MKDKMSEYEVLNGMNLLCRDVAGAAYALGERLSIMKGDLDPYNYEDWVRKNCSFDCSAANDYLRVFEVFKSRNQARNIPLRILFTLASGKCPNDVRQELIRTKAYEVITNQELSSLLDECNSYLESAKGRKVEVSDISRLIEKTLLGIERRKEIQENINRLSWMKKDISKKMAQFEWPFEIDESNEELISQAAEIGHGIVEAVNGKLPSLKEIVG
jgi:hypothetical protein